MFVVTVTLHLGHSNPAPRTGNVQTPTPQLSVSAMANANAPASAWRRRRDASWDQTYDGSATSRWPRRMKPLPASAGDCCPVELQVPASPAVALPLLPWTWRGSAVGVTRAEANGGSHRFHGRHYRPGSSTTPWPLCQLELKLHHGASLSPHRGLELRHGTRSSPCRRTPTGHRRCHSLAVLPLAAHRHLPVRTEVGEVRRGAGGLGAG